MPPKTNRNHSPKVDVLADIYLQLARMEEAGISPIQAFGNLSGADKNLSHQLQMTVQYIKSGLSIAESGYRTGLLNEIDRELIKAGESGGKLSDIYRQLAGYYGNKVRRLRKIKSRLYLPLTILLLALLIQPVPALFIGSISVLEYILSSFGMFIYILLLLYICWRLPQWLTEGRLRFLGLRQVVFQLQLMLPFVAPWIIRRQIREFLLILGLMLEAGVPVLQALPKTADTVKNAILRERLRTAENSLNNGLNISEAFAQIKEFNRTAMQLISSGEQSGKLPETLLHFAELEAEAIDLQEEMLAEWIPRMIYSAIVIWMAYSIIASYMAYFSALDKTISAL